MSIRCALSYRHYQVLKFWAKRDRLECVQSVAPGFTEDDFLAVSVDLDRQGLIVLRSPDRHHMTMAGHAVIRAGNRRA